MKVIGTTTCPNCNKEHPAEMDLDKFEPAKIQTPGFSVTGVSSTNTPTAATVQVEAPKEPEIKLVRIPPKDEPFYECKDCNKPHESKHYTERPRKKCTNCDSLNGESRKACKTCGNKEFEELDDQKLDDLGIPEPPEHEHKHEDE